ncbi:MAG: Ppx/GppA family phosphatase, partial [Armatimonadota bacterium]
ALVGIGGTVVNLACIAQEGASHTAVHGGMVSLESVSEIAERLGRMTLEERRTVPGLEPQRADVITAGAIIFQTLLEGLGVDEVVTSTRGARFGMIWEAVAGRWQ